MYNMNGLGDSTREIFFGVKERNIFFKGPALPYREGDDISYNKIENYKVIVRDGTVDRYSNLIPAVPLGVVKDSYRTVTNEEAFLPIEKAIINYFDPSILEDVQVKDHILKGGATCFSEYIFPATRRYGELETRSGHRTSLILRFINRNSYDGSSAVMLYGGNIDNYCTNGMIIGSYDVTKLRHTKNFNTEHFTIQFEQTLENFKSTVNALQKYADTLIMPNENKHVKNLFRKLTKGNIEEPQRNNTLSDRLFEQYEKEVEERGNNVFAVTSALTNYASHDSDRFSLTKMGDDGTLLKRQEKVRSWLDSDTFSDFVEYVAI
tara:strand:+ start:2167 stop:3129 length:963 start_codon:yes stop_codon:yes gene_type:complete